MKTHHILAASILFLLTAFGTISHAQSIAKPKIPEYEAKVRPFFATYCIRCHGAGEQNGEIRLDLFVDGSIDDTLQASDLQDALDALNSSKMPPEDEKQPKAKELAEVLRHLYEATGSAREYFSANASGSVVRRLNNRELVNILHDKFGINMQQDKLIADGGAEFDTQLGSLPISSFHVESYEIFAKASVDRIFARYYQKPGTYVRTLTGNRRHGGVAAGFSTRLNAWIPTADYTVRTKMWIENDDGQTEIYVAVNANGRSSTPVTGTRENPQVFEYKYYNDEAMSNRLVRSFGIKTDLDLTSYANPPKYLLILDGNYDNSEHIEEPFLNFDREVELTAVVDNTKVRQIFGEDLLQYTAPDHARVKGGKGYPPDSMAGDVIEDFYRALHARPIPESVLDSLVNLYEMKREQGDHFWDAIRVPLAGLFTSPVFLYQSEYETSEGVKLAHRLARLLWSSNPDSRLIELGRNGRLLDERVLEAEFERMLQDDKSERFIRSFVYQWLEFERVDNVMFNKALFPVSVTSSKKQAHDGLLHAISEEVYHVVKDLLLNNEPIIRFVDSDTTYLNRRLASHYGVKVDRELGGDFEKVKLDSESARKYGGLVTKSAFNVLTSNGTRTSPVERGAFILRKFLNDPPPPAPPNVPMIADSSSGDESAWKILAAHRSVAQCNSCHEKIDGVGFGLENFDPIGIWRTVERRVEVIPAEDDDPAKEVRKVYAVPDLHTGGHYGGIAFDDFDGFKKMMRAHQENMAKSFVEAIMSYSMGRHAGFTEIEAVDSIVLQTKDEGYRLRDLLYHYIRSDRFIQ